MIDCVKMADITQYYISIERLQLCVAEIIRWCAFRWLQLNPLNTELIWFGMMASLEKIEDVSFVLKLVSDAIKPVSVVASFENSVLSSI